MNKQGKNGIEWCDYCGSSEFREQKYNEPTDRDGGRVVFITRYICKQCGNIIDY